MIRKLIEVQYMIRGIEREVDEGLCLRVQLEVRGKSDKEVKEYIEQMDL